MSTTGNIPPEDDTFGAVTALWAADAEPPKDDDQGSKQAPTEATDGTGENPVEPDNSPELAILLMGATGSGKSSFINLVSGSSLRVGDGLRSCTSTVQPAPPFKLDDYRVVLVDMPGFDDTTRSDTEILEVIVGYLAHSYNEGQLIAGVLYFQRISDVRMGGVSTRNFNMFKKLCGYHAFSNVVIVTNMWGEVDPKVGAAREAELKNDDLFFKSILHGGAEMARHLNTESSGREIVRRVLHKKPQILQILKEVMLEGKDISRTSAGEELNKDLIARIRRYEEEMRVLKQDMEQAIKENDERAKGEIEVEAKKVKGEIARFRHDALRLSHHRKDTESSSEVHEHEQNGKPSKKKTQSQPTVPWKVWRYIINRVGGTPQKDSLEGESGGAHKATRKHESEGESSGAHRNTQKDGLRRENTGKQKPAQEDGLRGGNTGKHKSAQIDGLGGENGGTHKTVRQGTSEGEVKGARKPVRQGTLEGESSGPRKTLKGIAEKQNSLMSEKNCSQGHQHRP